MHLALSSEGSIAETIFGGKLHWFDEVDSTNTLALQAAAQAAPEGTVFLADSQTSGRGRGGHSWHSEPGTGLYFSAVLRPPFSPQEALWISLAAGAAVHHAVSFQTGLNPDIRWPNDLLLNGKKFCGILTEMQDGAAVVGIGVNLNHAAFPSEIADLATSLRLETGKEYERFPLLAAILQQLDQEYRLLKRESPVGEHLARLLPTLSTWINGKRVFVPEQGGYEGVTAGLDPHGFLLVNTADGTRRVLSGGVREP